MVGNLHYQKMLLLFDLITYFQSCRAKETDILVI